MSTVTPIRPMPAIPQTHYDAMAYIQSLAIVVSLQNRYVVNVEYCGHIHQLRVAVMRRSELKQGNYKADATTRVDYDPMENPAEKMRQLHTITRELEDLLTPPTGDDAA